MKLKAVSAGLALAVFWGVSLAILTAISAYTGYMADQLGLLVGVYPYYELSVTGAVAGLIDGLVDGFFVGWILATLYNAFAGCCCKVCK
ncbi:hypothetical protein COW94_03615 [Candidatus Peregrinibacteria bacterium CG22_combo_CG10-13_8_21_14_all_44_10]|nr:MAG: hypothetical protein AUK45_02195 [Candidatus Peregrinibacteria bacterium CG2_30_44_17]PIP66085.1 MAG: hypothetical protein COW94_03615 [Candidatus Peregrinibacteria bacterium CG22_combo_CG10-13_8_21_14_all_44_10]PIS04356.1 MAG: hypothetical protein COT83_00995 [Candidatus Peregrinibacteria bacterium CG10_big_fil_rev_8_21_14_0_10_44_7]PIX79244.1 MAG: hypothetical protein COZ35_03795 [Candidatus Peregrinibacteria bacterium CG_4_10_14_3_um_filter_44_21]PJB88449.1 MAG: hypothetical protein 